jgi:hypothetical protein
MEGGERRGTHSAFPRRGRGRTGSSTGRSRTTCATGSPPRWATKGTRGTRCGPGRHDASHDAGRGFRGAPAARPHAGRGVTFPSNPPVASIAPHHSTHSTAQPSPAPRTPASSSPTPPQVIRAPEPTPAPHGTTQVSPLEPPAASQPPRSPPHAMLVGCPSSRHIHSSDRTRSSGAPAITAEHAAAPTAPSGSGTPSSSTMPSPRATASVPRRPDALSRRDRARGHAGAQQVASPPPPFPSLQY